MTTPITSLPNNPTDYLEQLGQIRNSIEQVRVTAEKGGNSLKGTSPDFRHLMSDFDQYEKWCGQNTNVVKAALTDVTNASALGASAGRGGNSESP